MKRGSPDMELSIYPKTLTFIFIATKHEETIMAVI